MPLRRLRINIDFDGFDFGSDAGVCAGDAKAFCPASAVGEDLDPSSLVDVLMGDDDVEFAKTTPRDSVAVRGLFNLEQTNQVSQKKKKDIGHHSA